MEVDTSMQILDWEAIRLSKSKVQAESDYEGPVIFYDDSITLHHASY